jgi:hypothetical protein
MHVKATQQAIGTISVASWHGRLIVKWQAPSRVSNQWWLSFSQHFGCHDWAYYSRAGKHWSLRNNRPNRERLLRWLELVAPEQAVTWPGVL